jgi:hypothetical protein
VKIKIEDYTPATQEQEPLSRASSQVSNGSIRSGIAPILPEKAFLFRIYKHAS